MAARPGHQSLVTSCRLMGLLQRPNRLSLRLTRIGHRVFQWFSRFVIAQLLERKMSQAIVEIRDYTIDPDWIDAYKDWADAFAAPWLRANLDVIDFWVDCGIEPLVEGSNPQVSSNGQPNVTWIIRWASKVDRDTNFPAFTKSPEWQAIWARHPNPNAYLHMNARFMRAAG